VKQPNVLVLFPDQLRAQTLPIYQGTYGAQQISTPNIDRLAAQGMTLDNAISNCPVCTPARAMLVTGRYPQTTGHLIKTDSNASFRNQYCRCFRASGLSDWMGWQVASAYGLVAGHR